MSWLERVIAWAKRTYRYYRDCPGPGCCRNCPYCIDDHSIWGYCSLNSNVRCS